MNIQDKIPKRSVWIPAHGGGSPGSKKVEIVGYLDGANGELRLLARRGSETLMLSADVFLSGLAFKRSFKNGKAEVGKCKAKSK